MALQWKKLRDNFQSGKWWNIRFREVVEFLDRSILKT